ncbi:hypothetical protein I4U23_019601 [Adineta vaga]|nr:hypothetical protein I4U23_019601 [Adineta vaga]
MHLTGRFLLLCVFIGMNSAFLPVSIKWPFWKSSFFSDPIRTTTKEICSYLIQHPDRAEIGLNKMNETLHKTDDTIRIFPGTLAYINLMDNREKLTNNTDTCTTFFNEVKDILMTDLKTNFFNVKDAENQALDTLKSFHDILKSLIQ